MKRLFALIFVLALAHPAWALEGHGGASGGPGTVTTSAPLSGTGTAGSPVTLAPTASVKMASGCVGASCTIQSGAFELNLSGNTDGIVYFGTSGNEWFYLNSGTFKLNNGVYDLFLPPAAPTVSGQVMAATTAGVASWAAPSIAPHTLTCNTTTTAVVTSVTMPRVDVNNLVLSANCATVTLPASTAIADGEIINITVVQPSGSHSYTFPTTLTAGAGTQVEFEATGGCASMPAMPTGTDNELLLGIHYNANTATPTYDIVNCATQTTGS
jgi:hypothetical protein